MRRVGVTLVSVLLGVSCLPEFHTAAQGTGGTADVDAAGGGAGTLAGGDAGTLAGGRAGGGGASGAAAGAGGSAPDAAAGAGGGDPCAAKDCLGAKCNAGLCEPVVLSETGLRYGAGIAVTDTHVYFSNSEPFAIYRCPLSGCGAGEGDRVAIAPGEHAFDLVTSNGYLYWSASSSPGAVKRCAIPSCGNPQTLTKSLTTQVNRIAVDDTEFYFGADSAAASCPVSGCTLSTTHGYTPNFLVLRVAVSPTYVFWSSTDTRLRRALKTDAASATEVASGVSTEVFALDADYAYFPVNPPAPASIKRCPLAACGGPGSATDVAPLSNVAAALIVDENWLYWAEFSAAPTSVKRVPRAGGLPNPIAQNQAAPIAFAQDATALYWINQGLAKPGQGGSIMRWAK